MYQYEFGEVAWLKTSIKNGLPNVAVEVLEIFDNLVSVHKTNETIDKSFMVLNEELINHAEVTKMIDKA
jgi:hypothetical protein